MYASFDKRQKSNNKGQASISIIDTSQKQLHCKIIGRTLTVGNEYAIAARETKLIIRFHDDIDDIIIIIIIIDDVNNNLLFHALRCTDGAVMGGPSGRNGAAGG
jgi:hypothetical protein